jgi:RimJ/RimL family protein N-acetyltransferase
LAWFRVISARTDEYRCAILSDGEYIGNTYLTGIHAGEAEYQIFIGNPSYRRQGIAAQVTDIVLDYAKWTLGIKKITAEVHSDNLASRRMLESLGFRIFSSGDDGFLQMVLELDALSETINKFDAAPTHKRPCAHENP